MITPQSQHKGIWSDSLDFYGGDVRIDPSPRKYYNVTIVTRRSSSCVSCRTVYYTDAQELKRYLNRKDVLRVEEVGSFWMEHKEAGNGC